jgi:hypothetical protein
MALAGGRAGVIGGTSVFRVELSPLRRLDRGLASAAVRQCAASPTALSRPDARELRPVCG